jgi:hypothetical protein
VKAAFLVPARKVRTGEKSGTGTAKAALPVPIFRATEFIIQKNQLFAPKSIFE